MRKKDRKWLEQIARATDHSGSIYPGERVDLVPDTVAHRLGSYINVHIPHNPVHKERWVITPEGRAALAVNAPLTTPARGSDADG